MTTLLGFLTVVLGLLLLAYDGSLAALTLASAALTPAFVRPGCWLDYPHSAHFH